MKNTSSLPTRSRLTDSRANVNALLGLSLTRSYFYLPPRRSRSMVLVSDVIALLARSARNGAAKDTIPQDLVLMDEAMELTGFTGARLRRLYSRIPHYRISRNNLIVTKDALMEALAQKPRRRKSSFCGYTDAYLREHPEVAALVERAKKLAAEM